MLKLAILKYPRPLPLLLLIFVTLILTSCAAGTTAVQSEVPAATLMPTHVPTTTPEPAALASNCNLSPIVVPTIPAEIPRYIMLDPDTQLHMTGTVQEIDPVRYRLEITGKVNNPLSLTLDDLRCMPKIETDNKLECPGFFIDYAEWAGAPLAKVLEMAGLQEDAEKIILVSADGYKRDMDLNVAMRDINFLAYEWNGEPLPILHGFPVRAVFPEEFGGVWVKWLVRIEVE